MVLNSNILHQLIGFSRNIFEVQLFNIGDWNMDTDTNKQVVWNIGAKYKNIVLTYVLIRDDDNLYYTSLETPGSAGLVVGGGIYFWTDTVIELRRNTAGPFNSPAYDSIGYNRGTIFIVYHI